MQSELQLAVEAARCAGAFLKQQRTVRCHLLSQEARDIKLQEDQDSEALIRQHLAPMGYAVIGEEGGGNEALLQQNERFWVIDPLDGTYNYFRGLMNCCVSIALMCGQEPLLGVIYDFTTDTIFTGCVGETFKVNGHEVRPCWAETPAQGALMTGFPTAYVGGKEAEFFKRIGYFKKVRMNGSAALALAYVAAGYADAYAEEGIRLWDIAAGLALLRCVGAYVDMRPSANKKPLSYDLLVLPKQSWLPL